ncbi:uncharacterized protein MKZ38_007634 [Zalerion maritima]|uniref:Rhodopsin domain-containing protein n=1 Tax=Zalerion maritima TaxID=339359 RepID=A0AAD5S6D7_9PEZI|nr:uncharacterized protein MKZ38_007634 [Zalerion maritima]
MENETRAPYMISVTIGLLSLLVCSVLLRTVVRIRHGGAGWDDAFLYLSFAWCTTFLVSVIMNTQNGLGYHWEFTTDEQKGGYMKVGNLISCSYILGFVTVKLSFACLYLRLMTERKYQLLNKGLVIFLLCQGIEEVCVVLFRCKPIHKAWTLGAEGTCIDLLPFYYTAFAFKFITDVILFVQPIPTLWRLQLPLGKRIGLIIMMSIGLLVCIISIIRVTYIGSVGPDPTWLVVDSMIWSEIEVTALIVCACVPSLRHVIQKIPALSKALGLSSERSKMFYGRSYGGRSKGVSIALNSRSGPQSANAAHPQRDKSAQFGLTSAAVGAGNRASSSESTEEIVGNGKKFGIMVTHDIEMGVESNHDSPTATACGRDENGNSDVGVGATVGDATGRTPAAAIGGAYVCPTNRSSWLKDQ